MGVHLFFADWPAARSLADGTVLGRAAERLVHDGTPILLDDAMRPLELWCRFLRQYSLTVGAKSIRAYAGDMARFARFLEVCGVRVQDATQDDLVGYRTSRQAELIADSTWSRELVVIRALFHYLVAIGVRSDLPWIQIGQRSVVHPRLAHRELQVRALSQAQWLAFRDVGMGGSLPDGSFDESYRGRTPTRDVTAVDLAVTTGMRIQEWRTLLDVELQRDGDHGATINLSATAKNRRRRTVYVPAATVRTIELYRLTERRRAILQAQPALRGHRDQLAFVQDVDVAAGRVAYQFSGKSHRLRFSEIPVDHRRLLVRDVDGIVEPMSLFVGQGGRQPSQRSWHERFARANQRLSVFRDEIPLMPAAVTPHALRHTFAVVVLQSLQLRAIEYETRRPRVGFGTMSEHLTFNPLLTLQRPLSDRLV